MTIDDSNRRTPWHIWAVGILTLLWNGSGAYTIMMAQAGRLANINADEAAYYAAQPSWFVVATDIALAAAVAAGVALLLRRRAAVSLFALSLSAIVATNAYDLAAGTSRTLVEPCGSCRHAAHRNDRRSPAPVFVDHAAARVAEISRFSWLRRWTPWRARTRS